MCCPTMSSSTFTVIQTELKEFGYHQQLVPECLPLVQQLLGDLKTTTSSLQKYMKIAKHALEERDSLQLGAEPYKCDNARLVKECNDLQSALDKLKQEHDDLQKELGGKITTLVRKKQQEKQDVCRRLDKFEKTNRPKFASKGGKKVQTAMSIADDKISYLTDEIQLLKEQQLQLLENNDVLERKIKGRDTEIRRLHSLLDVNGRSMEFLTTDCCYKNIDSKVKGFQDEIKNLMSEKKDLQHSLQEAVSKQHEAMTRALHLAEKNKELEQELKDIDQIALAVEAECNNTARDNAGKVGRLQDKVNKCTLKLETLEQENAKLKTDEEEFLSKLNSLKLEKNKLQRLLDGELDERKLLTDKLNRFAIIEHDLNMEIDRLARKCAEQKHKIAELEYQILSDKIQADTKSGGTSGAATQKVRQAITYPSNANQTRKTTTSAGSSHSRRSVSKFTTTTETTKIKSKSSQKLTKLDNNKNSNKLSTCLEKGEEEFKSDRPESKSIYNNIVDKCCSSCAKYIKELLDKEIESRHTQMEKSLDILKEEKDYYMKEYHKLVEGLKEGPSKCDKAYEVLQHYQKILDDLRNIPSKCEKTYEAIKDYQQIIDELKHAPNKCDKALEAIKDYQKLLDLQASSKVDKAIELLREEKNFFEKQCKELKEKLRQAEESLSTRRLIDEPDFVRGNLEGTLDKPSKKRDENWERTIENLTYEKNYYKGECDKLMQQLQSQDIVSSRCIDLHSKLSDRDNRLQSLQDQLLQLEKEKHSLLLRLQNNETEACMERASCNKTTCKANYRALETAKKELAQLKDEYDAMHQRLNSMTRVCSGEQDYWKVANKELQERVDTLEKERMRLFEQQSTRKTCEDKVQSENATLKEELRQVQNELNSKTASYNHLMNLHKNSEKSLEDNHARIMQLERELSDQVASLSKHSRVSSAHEGRISVMDNELKILKEQLSKMDKQKDDLMEQLDHKAERIVELESKLKKCQNQMVDMESKMNAEQSKLRKLVEDSSYQDGSLRRSKEQIQDLQRRIEDDQKLRSALEKKNKQLQDEIAQLKNDRRFGLKDLDSSRQEVEDLKTQLQQYVAEVRKTEDLLARKELERNELLEQFKSLTDEATALECNNHTLETEASQTKVQLNVCLDHTSDLEKRIADQESNLRSYEMQIGQLSAQVANVEADLRQAIAEKRSYEQQLRQAEDIATRLDQERHCLNDQVEKKERQYQDLSKRLMRVTNENGKYQDHLTKEQSNLNGLEKMLNDARQELIEQRLHNEEMDSELQRLKSIVSELHARIASLESQLEVYREKALEYSQQNKQLRREVANERFYRTQPDSAKKIVSSNGVVAVKQRAAGCLSYSADKFGYKSQLARTLTQSGCLSWDSSPGSIQSFTSDLAVWNFCEHFLIGPSEVTKAEAQLREGLTRITYEAVVKDKLIGMALFKFVSTGIGNGKIELKFISQRFGNGRMGNGLRRDYQSARSETSR